MKNIMANLTETNVNKTAYNFRWGVWKFDFFVNIILTVVSFYLLIALLYHEIKVQKPYSNRVEKYSLASKYICISIAFLSIVRNVTGVISGVVVEETGILSYKAMQQAGVAEIFCNLLRKLSNLALTLGNALVYWFLWCRQRIFYIHPTLRIIENRFLQHFSNDAIKVWLLPWVILHFVYFSSISYRFDKAGICQFEFGSGGDWDYAKLIFTWVVISAVMQVCLLVLFITPIYKSAEWMDDHQNNQNSSLMKSVKKASILAFICIVTELSAIFVLYLFYEENSNTLTTPHSLNLVINHLATIAYFDDWRDMLWPWNKEYKPNVALLSDDESCPTESSPLIYANTNL